MHDGLIPVPYGSMCCTYHQLKYSSPMLARERKREREREVSQWKRKTDSDRLVTCPTEMILISQWGNTGGGPAVAKIDRLFHWGVYSGSVVRAPEFKSEDPRSIGWIPGWGSVNKGQFFKEFNPPRSFRTKQPFICTKIIIQIIKNRNKKPWWLASRIFRQRK